jgi:hypothetical protein
VGSYSRRIRIDPGASWSLGFSESARVEDDAQVWRERIAAAWQKGAEAIFETGRLLVQAKAELPHGKFTEMIREKLPFSPQWARKYIAIASNKNLSKGNPSFVLPAEVKTLIELTKLDDGAYAPPTACARCTLPSSTPPPPTRIA